VGSTWTILGATIVTGAPTGRYDKLALSSDGYTVIAGEPNAQQNARIYRYNGSAWSQLGQTITETGASYFGGDVAINFDGTVVAIGAAYMSASAGSTAGRVFTYKYNGTSWVRIGQSIDGIASGNLCGLTVSLSRDGTILAAGSPNYASNLGQIRVYSIPHTGGYARTITMDLSTTAINNSLTVAGNTTLSTVTVAGNTTLSTVTANKINTLLDISVNSLNLGRGAGNDITSLAFGVNALASQPSGLYSNIAIGYYALTAPTGSTNTAIGVSALQANTNGGYNIGIGNNALRYNTGGGFNTAIGAAALQANTTGSNNIAIEWAALIANSTGSHNIALGTQSLTGNQSGSNNIAIGTLALKSNTSNSNSTAVGWRALLDTTGTSNTAFGYIAGANITTGTFNTFIGYDANSTGGTWSNSTAIGANSRITASNQITLGTATENVNILGTINTLRVGLGGGSISTNSAVGFQALQANNTGTGQNSAFGYQTLFSNTSGNQNTANGYQALYSNTTGNLNTANGAQALRNNTTGSENVANGYYALRANTTGNLNTANGSSSLRANTTGNNNTGNGRESFYNNTTGNNNTGNGYQALYNNTTGSNNTADGYYAGLNNTTGSNNTFIGSGTNISPTNATWTSSTAIGVNATITASNQIVLGTSMETLYIPGKVTIVNDASFNGRVDICGNFYANSPTFTGDVIMNGIPIKTIPAISSTTTITGNTWSKLGNTISGAATGDQFGYSVAMNDAGDRVVIGAITNNGNGSISGQVRVFQYSNGTWSPLGQAINGETAGDRFGWWVTMNSEGNIFAASSLYNSSVRGSTRVYQYINNTWTQIGQDIDGVSANDWSGKGISLNSAGTILAIGSADSDLNGTDAGCTRVYEYINNTWTQIGQNILGQAAYNYSGASVSLNSAGNIVAIGSGSYSSTRGNARIFQYSNSTWVQLGQEIVGVTTSEFLGIPLCLNGDGTIIILSAYNSSKVRVYKYSNSTWGQLGTDILGESSVVGPTGDYFGSSVSINDAGNIIAVGASQNDGNGSNAGSVRLYNYINNNWSPIGAEIDGTTAGGQFGVSVSLNSAGNIVAIGANKNALDKGETFVYSIASTTSIPTPSRIDICGNFYAQYPNSSIPASAIIGGLNANSDISLNNNLSVGGNASFNGRVDICGNFYAQYPPNSIPASAIIGGVGGGGSGSSTGSNISFDNSFALIKEAAVVDTASVLLRQF
jgi:hypothetical protein